VSNSFEEILSGWQDEFERTYTTALNYQEFLMPLLRKGAFLEEITREIIKKWEEVRVFP
jgi:hypothetical protein